MANVNGYNGGQKILLLLLLLASCQAFGQLNYKLKIIATDKDSALINKQVAAKDYYASPLLLNDFIKKLPSLLQSKGFVASSIDSIETSGVTTKVYVFMGDEFKLSNLYIKSSDSLLLQTVAPALLHNIVTFQAYLSAQQKLLDYFENEGFPFATIKLDSVVMQGENVSAHLVVSKGIPYSIDSIRLMGPAKISKNFLHHYLDLQKGSPYKKAKLEKINLRLAELSFVEQAQPWDIMMLNTGSMLNLYLQPKKSNQINVLAGFLPSNQQIGGKLLFTIDANLNLQNAFGSGERIGLMWQQIQPKSPRLHIDYTQPYIFNSSFGVDFNFDLFKRDSTFFNINSQFGLQYVLSASKTGKIVIQNNRTNVLQVDTFRIKAFRQLPDVADVSSINLGIEYDVNNTNYRPNPSRGNQLTFYAGAGNKKIRKNTTVTQLKDPAFNYNSLYDSIKLNTYQLLLRIQASHYISLGKQSVLKTATQAGWYQSPNYYRNELFQIGGYKLLRGFDEQSIYADKYVVGTFEYRYLLDANSHFAVFTDIGWSKNNITKITNNYLGAGLGLSFQRREGIFNISYAAGKRNDLNFDIRQSKIHFGYVSLF